MPQHHQRWWKLFLPKKKKKIKLFTQTPLCWKWAKHKTPVTLQSRMNPREWKVKTPKAAPILGLWAFKQLMVPRCCDTAVILKVFLLDLQLVSQEDYKFWWATDCTLQLTLTSRLDLRVIVSLTLVALYASFKGRPTATTAFWRIARLSVLCDCQ